MRPLGGWLCTGLLATPALTLAAERAPVAVIAGQDADDPRVVAAVWAIRAAMERAPDVAPVSIDERLGEDREPPAEAGRAALVEGRQAFGDLDLERAARALEAAARLLVPLPDRKLEAVEALDLLAQTRAAARDEAGAAAAYRRLVVLDPEFEPDIEALGPTVAKAWRSAAAALAGPPPGPLRVESSMAPAAVFVDGRFAGVTPHLIRRPDSAPLSLELRADGFAPWRRTVTLRPGQSAALEPALEPLGRSPLLYDILEKLPEQMDRETTGPALKDLRSLLFAEQAVLVAVRGGDVQAALFDLKLGRRVRSLRYSPAGGTATVSDGSAIVEALYAGVDALAPGTTELAEEPETLDAGGRGRLVDAWWFWPAVGVAAATAVAVPIIVLSGDDDTAIRERDGEGAVVLRF
ncbi:PEGA domain-containing protein [Myxococcota bacterium]|nr:PEGA domain-containing protein [Myxococcota bacterium]